MNTEQAMFIRWCVIAVKLIMKYLSLPTMKYVLV